MKRILMVALEFPPCHSSGVQRTFKFAEFLCEMGWDPLILTADVGAYENLDNSFEIPKCLEGKIFRAPCINLKKMFSINGKYPAFVEYFDKYWPWYISALPMGLNLINKYKPDVIWSTYPVITAHMIAYKLSKKTGISWVMDYRDPIRQHYDPNYANANRLTFYLEKKMIRQCEKAIFTTQRAVDFYKRIYPADENKFEKISNGYSVKLDLPINIVAKEKYIFLHSGVLYGEERDITPLLQAVYILSKEKPKFLDNLIIRFRGAFASNKIKNLMDELDINRNFEFLPPISFEESVAEMSEVDGFILIQSEKFCNQVPGKLYEYCQFQKPILALCSKNSATYDEVKHLGNVFFASSVGQILESFFKLIDNQQKYEYPIEEFSRFEKTKHLAEIINKM